MTQSMLEPAVASPHHLNLSAIGRRTAVSLIVACAVPAFIFWSCYERFGVHTAMGVALAWAYGALAWRALTGRPVSGMLIVTSVVLTARTIIALLAHSSFLYFVQPALSDSVVGLAFLASMVAGRPLTSKLAGDFCPLTEELAGGATMQNLFRRMALGWGFFLIGKALLIVWLLQELTTDDFVRTMSVVNPALNISAATFTLTASIAAVRQAGLLTHAVPLEPVLEVSPVAA